MEPLCLRWCILSLAAVWVTGEPQSRHPGRDSKPMIRHLPTVLASVHLDRVAGIARPADPPGLTIHPSAMLRAVVEQLLPIGGPLIPPYTLTRSISRSVKGSVTLPTPGLYNGVETTVFASSVDFGALIDFPDWTAQVFIYAGLCLLLLGLMAWLGSYRLQRRAWGRRLALSGGGLFVVGSAWSTFLSLLTYVLG